MSSKEIKLCQPLLKRKLKSVMMTHLTQIDLANKTQEESCKRVGLRDKGSRGMNSLQNPPKVSFKAMAKV